MTTHSANAWAVVLAAGQGSRLAKAGVGKKQFILWKGLPLFWHSARTFARIPAVRGVVFVFPEQELGEMADKIGELDLQTPLSIPFKAVQGGERRQDSVYNALKALPADCDAVLVHDAARPFASAPMIQSLLDELGNGADGAIPAIPVKDTVKRVGPGSGQSEPVAETLTRGELRAVQTPQAFPLPILLKAHELAQAESWTVTDDASMVERIGTVVCVPGEETNVKITTPEDLKLLTDQAQPMPRVGWGYDVHRYGGDRPMKLGGVDIPNAPTIKAHSDGDVLLHALADAILGCMCAGDIGQHFPDTDPSLDNVSSSILLKEVMAKAAQAGLTLVHVDMTVIAQIPKLAPWREAIRDNVAALVGLDPSAVNFKATTEEGLGFTGEKKGVKAVAAVTAFIAPQANS